MTSPGTSPGTTASPWEVVIGLEVHCQLRTATKLFCGCRNAFGAPPNSLTCPVCTGQPGALPVLNREALSLALRAALALDGEIAPRSEFDRKNYFYCDLPKGFQITQFARPYCGGASLELPGGKRVRLARIHLEEDAGKAIHDRGARTLVDLNRAGVPLIESVTEPDLASAEEAFAYLTELKAVLQYVGASDCDMEKGSLRCDVNVSVRHPGEPLRTKVELKNLNSFSNVKAAIEHEVARQIEAYESGDPARYPVQETRGWDDHARTSRSQRGKEDADDYRYFPEPDLPPIAVPSEWIERERGFVPELPAARRRRYVEALSLSEYDAGVLTATRELADFFERAVQLADGGPGAAKEVANWISNDVLRLVSDPDLPWQDLGELPLRPGDVADLVRLVGEGRVSKNAGRKVLRGIVDTGHRAADVVRELGLEQVDDAGAIEDWCRAALAERPDVVADVRAGTQKAVGALIGAVMQASGGAADPKTVRATLLRLIDEGV